MLAKAGAEVAATGPGTLTVAGLPAERAVVLLSEHAIPFSEVTAHRATLEEAYLELTKDAVEFQAGGPAGLAGQVVSMTTITTSRPMAPPARPASRTCCTPSGPSSGLFAAGSSPSSSRCW